MPVPHEDDGRQTWRRHRRTRRASLKGQPAQERPARGPRTRRSALRVRSKRRRPNGKLMPVSNRRAAVPVVIGLSSSVPSVEWAAHSRSVGSSRRDNGINADSSWTVERIASVSRQPPAGTNRPSAEPRKNQSGRRSPRTPTACPPDPSRPATARLPANPGALRACSCRCHRPHHPTAKKCRRTLLRWRGIDRRAHSRLRNLRCRKDVRQMRVEAQVITSVSIRIARNFIWEFSQTVYPAQKAPALNMPVVRIILSIYFLHHARYLVVIPPLVAIPVRQKRKLQRWKQER